mmetsp:Transcript_24021/g.56034  ORF Transcript_24021/g.56034 Transcript_24021/m.56034 type:complete len:198 (+) Transcript_24021:195-788(+)
MAGDDAWDQISRVTDVCIRKDDFFSALTSKGRWHEPVKTILQAIPLDSPNAKYQIKSAILLNHLVSFHKNTGGRLRGRPEYIARDVEVPVDVTKRFLESFTTLVTGEGGMPGYAFSKQNKDKILVHILLLFIISQGRKMKVGNIKPIVDEMKIVMTDATNLLREAGVTVQKAGDTVSAGLTVPLKFPLPKSRGRQKS